MSNSLIIPRAHYFTKPSPATPEVFNRVWDDINNSFRFLFDGSIACNAEHDVVILRRNGQVAPNTVRISDVSFWPTSVSNVSLSFSLANGSGGTISTVDNGKGGYAQWTAPAGGYSWVADKAPIQILVNMTATYTVERIEEEVFSGSGSSYTLSATPVSGSVEAFIDESPVSVSSVSGKTVTLGQSASNGSTVRIRYMMSVNDSRTATTGFVIMAEPAQGAAAVTVPKIIVHTPATVQPLYGKSDGSVVSEMLFFDHSLIAPNDTAVRQWEVYDDSNPGVDIINSVIAAGYTAGDIATAVNGSQTLKLAFTQAGSYTVRLRVNSSTYGEQSGDVNIRVLPLWQVEPVFALNPSTTVAPVTKVLRYSYFDSKPLDNANYYLTDLTQKATLRIYCGIENTGNIPITGVGPQQDGSYQVHMNGSIVVDNGIFGTTDVRSGIDYLWIDGKGYPILDYQEQGDEIITIAIPEGYDPPTASSVVNGIATTADEIFAKVELYDSANTLIKTLEKVATRTAMPVWYIDFDHIDYGAKFKATLYGRFGTVLSQKVAMGNTANITPSQLLPNINQITMKATAVNTQYYTISFFFDVNGPAPVLYEVEYAGHPAFQRTVMRSTTPFISVPVDPSSTGSILIFRVYDKYGRKVEYNAGSHAWGDDVIAPGAPV
jgi:hypothetical protein